MPQFLIPFPVSVAGLKNDVSDGASHCGDERLSSLVAAGDGWWFLAWLVCVCNWGVTVAYGFGVWLMVAGVGSLWINDQGGMQPGMLLVGRELE